MDCEGNHHAAGDLAVAMRCGIIEMAGGARGTNVIDVFGDNREDDVPRSESDENAPPRKDRAGAGKDCEDRDTQQRARAETDERAEPAV